MNMWARHTLRICTPSRHRNLLYMSINYCEHNTKISCRRWQVYSPSYPKFQILCHRWWETWPSTSPFTKQNNTPHFTICTYIGWKTATNSMGQQFLYIYGDTMVSCRCIASSKVQLAVMQIHCSYCRAYQREALNEWSILAMYARTCLSRSGMSICARMDAEELMCHVTFTDNQEYRMPWVGQRGWSSAMYVFCGVEYWTPLMVGGIEKEKAKKTM